MDLGNEINIGRALQTLRETADGRREGLLLPLRDREKFRQAWRAAGYPPNFSWDPRTNRGVVGGAKPVRGQVTKSPAMAARRLRVSILQAECERVV